MITIIKQLILFFFNIIRQPLWKLRGNQVSIHARICKGTLLRNCKIAPYVYIGRNCILNNTIIDEYSSIASDVQIGGMEHAYWTHSTSHHLTSYNIESNITHISADCWVAAGCIIKQGISLGLGSVLGANSFLNKNTPDFSIWVGSPAKLLKYRFDKELQKKIYQSRYWKLTPKSAKKVLQTIT